MNLPPTIANSNYPEILCWGRSSIELADVVYESYLDVLISTFVDRVSEPDNDQSSRFWSLPKASIRRIMEAPETYNQLVRAIRGPDHRFDCHIRDSVDVEMARHSSKEDRYAAKKWSATGDLFFDVTDEPEFDECGWRIGGYFAAHLLGNKLPLDNQSIHARRSMPVAPFRSVQFGDPEPMSLNEERTAASKIVESFDMVEAMVPCAATFILRYAKSLVLRKNSLSSGVFQSASRNAFIGQIVFLNAHEPHVDREYIAESLVHESIHSLLWRAEILDHFIVDSNKPLGTTRSPWSGEQIYYYTLLQACLVWYGIYCFWSKVLSQTSLFRKERVAFLCERAKLGFLVDDYEASLGSHRDNLKHGVYETFIELRNRVARVD